MDKSQALNAFWNGFLLPAYDENSVPDDAQMPYITYEVATGRIDEPVMLSASLWYQSTSWMDISRKADEIGKAIRDMKPPSLKLDDGRLYLYQGNPFARRSGAVETQGVKRIILTIEVEYLTDY